MITLNLLQDDHLLEAKTASRVLREIDNTLIENFLNEPSRSYLGASGVGNPCARAVQFDYIKADKDEGKEYPPPRILRIFQRGHHAEHLVVKWFRNAGYHLTDRDHKTGKQFRFSVADGLFSGGCDGVISEGPGIEGPTLWELKCVNTKKFKKFVSKGVEKTEPKYYAQLQVYMAYFGLTDYPALFTVLDSDSYELHIEEVPFNAQKAQEYSDRAVDIIRDTDARALAPRVSDDPTSFACRFCDYSNLCHSGTNPMLSETYFSPRQRLAKRNGTDV